MAVLDRVASPQLRLPVFLMVERDDLDEIPLSVEEIVQEYVLVFEDTPSFVAGRIDYAWRRHTENLLPPFFATLVDFTESHEYSWHTPGHAGGTAFRKSQVGKAFYDFYGETLFRTDLVGLGRRARLAARPLRGRGRSGAQRREGVRGRRDLLRPERDLDLEPDRGARLRRGRRRRAGGPQLSQVGQLRLDGHRCDPGLPHAVAQRLRDHRSHPCGEALAQSHRRVRWRQTHSPTRREQAPVYAVVTNSTYDGLCYRADRVVELLGQSVPRVHFDEAWFAYARFHPLYRNRYAMHDRTPAAGDPTIFATQSTHKLLAAFSQASMIHIRPSERAPVEPSRFNEAYMMHGSTSPFYPMIACLDVATAMMDGPGGLRPRGGSDP